MDAFASVLATGTIYVLVTLHTMVIVAIIMLEFVLQFARAYKISTC
jgi:hypothetical protein